MNPRVTPLLSLLSVIFVICVTGTLQPRSNPLATVLGAPEPRTSGPAVRFDNVASSVGLAFNHINGASAERYLPEIMSGGGLFFDFDNDGWIDLYVTNVGLNTLYHNNGKGTFTDVTRPSGAGSPLWSTGCEFADFDRDGYLDLFVANYVDARVDNNIFCGDTASRIRDYCHPLSFAPLPSVLYRNNGDGTFTDVSQTAGIGEHRGNGLGAVFGDYDDDGWPDLFVANDTTPNFLYHNEHGSVFDEIGLVAGVAVASDGNPRAGMGTDFGDYDGDGRLDLFVTNHEFEMHTLFRNLGKGLFADMTSQSGVGLETLPFVGFGTVFLDYDNAGDLDLASVCGHVMNDPGHFKPGSTLAQRNLLFRNDGGGRMTEVGRVSGPGFALEKVGRALAAGDIDNDGDLDLLVVNNGGAAELLRNDGGRENNALIVRTTGTRSNRSGIGARLRLTAGGTTQVREIKAGSSYLAQNDLRVHFGLGRASRIDRLEIRWPAGVTDVVQNVAINQILTVVEGTGVTERAPFVRR